jgi:hypothetical protein
MRIYLYLLAGVTSALLGWNIGQFILSDLTQAFPFLQFLKQASELALFPSVAAALAIGIVLNEIFLSNPTRVKLNLRIAPIPVAIATGLGLFAGLLAGCISQILLIPQFQTSSSFVRVISWLCIGSSVGIAEGWTWRWRSIEAGDRKRFHRRLTNSIIFGNLASLAAAFLFEFVRKSLGQFPRELASLEDPLGISILGALLGIAFSITSSPSYIAALRAGAGFEYTETYTESSVPAPATNPPRINSEHLRFVSDGEAEQIEEGLSIQLPAKGTFSIGSGPKDHIFIPGLPPNIAQIELSSREAVIVTQSTNHSIAINGETLTSRRKALKHNYVVTFYPQDSHDYGKKIFRFVYYNRFLDPQS